MFILSLGWFIIGILIGLLAYAAGLQPVLKVRGRWLIILVADASITLLGGYLGTLLLGKFLATALTLWFTILLIFICPWLMKFIQTHPISS